MKILIVGMGLIGGSVCKALKNKTQYEVYGCDVDEAVLQQALQDHAIDGTGKMEDGIYDVCIVCLHHRIAQPCIKQALPFLKKGDSHGYVWLKGTNGTGIYKRLPDGRAVLCRNTPHGR